MVKKITIALLFCLSGILSAQNTYYVATGGSDAAAGSIGSPWATWNKAFQTAVAGDTVYIRGGVYYSTSAPSVANSGTSSSLISFFAYPGETPILDCSVRSGMEYNSGIAITEKQYIHFKGLTVRNVWQSQFSETLYSSSWGISAQSCANLTFERMTVHNIAGRGFWITGGAWGEHTADPIFPYDTTRFINVDVYDLCDTINYFIYPSNDWIGEGWAQGDTAHRPGNAADGWKTIHYAGNVVIWDGCRAWFYTDDGWDPTPVDGAERIITNSWAMATNKYYDICRAVNWKSGSEEWSYESMEGNGFKINSDHPTAGTFDTVSIRMENCIALFGSVGFLEIGGSASNGIYYNNTAYRNSIYGFAGYFSLQNSIYRNNLSFGTTEQVYLMGDYVQESNNTWRSTTGWPYWLANDTVTVTNADFITTDSATLVSLFTAARQSDGSLPVNRPLMLDEDSDLINAGIDVGLPFIGPAPDLGYIEYSGEITLVTSIDVYGTGNATTISTNDGTLQMVADILPIDATYQTVTWSRTNGTGTASINSSGLLTALTNGTVTVRATAVDGSGVYGEEVITISNQTEPTPSTSRFIQIGGKFVKSIRGNFIIK